MNNLIEAIKQLKKEKNAIILGHYYQKGEIQDIADYVGDSLALAQWAAKTEADIIVMCGVHFMGETAKVLCPDKKVLVPDMAAGCSLADSCPADKFAQFVKEHPGYIAGHSCFDGIKDYGGRVGAFFVADNFAACAFAPDL